MFGIERSDLLFAEQKLRRKRCTAGLARRSAAIEAAVAQAPAPIVFFDVAGPEAAKLPEFYSKLFGWRTDPRANANWSIPVTTPLLGTVRPGNPTEKRIYIGVDDIAAKLSEVAVNGGTIDAPRFEVPGVVVLGLFKDPAGNPMGLVEMVDGKPKIP